MIDENVTEQLESMATEPVSQEQAPQINTQETEKQAIEREQARNFRELRRQAEAIAQERDELRRILERQKQNPEETEIELQESDLVEAKHLKKQRKYIDNKVQTLQEQIEVQKQLIIEAKIRAQCPDFDSVVTAENVERLRNEYPEVAATIGSSPDLQSKAIASYKLIKKLNIHDVQSKLDKETISKNIAKPKPANALNKTDSPLTRAHGYSTGLSDSEKEAIWKRARDYAGNI